MLPKEYNPRQIRPMSELINPALYLSEAEIAGNWYEDLQNYERNLDEIASTNLDQNFKEEMQHVDQWYSYLTETEKTATMYTLLQHSSQVQMRFFINLLQQMVKRDPLYSLLAPNNPTQDKQHHLAGAMAKAELEASQRLMSVLPYKTGQVIRRPTTQQRRPVDRHSFALGDTEEYSQLFGRGPFGLEERTSGRLFQERPHSVIEGDTSFFSSWMNPSNTLPSSSVGHIGDRPKSADISHWPTHPPVWGDLTDFGNTGYQQRQSIHRVPGLDDPRPHSIYNSDQLNPFKPTTLQSIVDSTAHMTLHDFDTENRPLNTNGAVGSKISKDKKAVEVVDMELLKDVTSWLRSLRLHKYNPIFADSTWQEMIKMTDEQLLVKGVSALGARRKMLKVFDHVKAYCDANDIKY